jgi:hypothetical protein
VIFLYQLASALDLVWRRLPLHIENLIPGPKIPFGRFVAVHTPAHIERVRFPRQRHFVHPAMARGAADPFLDVNAVIEKDKVGQLIDALPA